MARSWGNVDKENHSQEIKVNWINDIEKINESETILSHGNGRTYSNSCLNKDGDLLLTRSLNKFISFDQTNGTLECESGLTFEEILNLIVPRGWFLPVTPGTKYVTLGGAIANDIHGKITTLWEILAITLNQLLFTTLRLESLDAPPMKRQTTSKQPLEELDLPVLFSQQNSS